MIFYTTNILILPLLLVIFIVDAYLILVAASWLLGALSGSSAYRHQTEWRRAAERPVRIAETHLSRWCRKPLPPWMPWAVVIFSAVLAHHLLAYAVQHLS